MDEEQHQMVVNYTGYSSELDPLKVSKCSCEIELIWSALATKCLRCGGEV